MTERLGRTPAETEEPILFYDGGCGVCSAMVAFILRHDRRRRTLRFASLQGPAGSGLRALHRELDSVDSMVWYESAGSRRGAVVRTRSAAAIAAGTYLGGGWGMAARLASFVPPALRDRAYDAFARSRHRLTRYNADCLLPSSDEARRFLDSHGGGDEKG